MKKIITPAFTEEASLLIRRHVVPVPNDSRIRVLGTSTCCGSFELHFAHHPDAGGNLTKEHIDGILSALKSVPPGRLVLCSLPIDGYAEDHPHQAFYLKVREYLSKLGFMAKAKWKNSNTGHTVILMMCFKEI